MQYATWLRRASWLTAIGIALSSGQGLLADDDAAADENAPPAKESAPATDPTAAKEPAPPKEPAAPEEAKRAKKVAKFQGRVLEPKYRLGVALAPIPPALNEQLDLKGEGLLIERVAPDAPADKAGIKPHDILLAVGDKAIKQYEDLIEGANASEGKVSLKLLRGGKTITVAVTLTKHKGDERIFVPKIGAVDTEEIEELIKEKLKKAGADVRLELFKPGKIFPPGVFLRKDDFPEDLTVKIQKEGKAPASVEVKRGDKTWSVKEDDLDELPDDVRPHVEALLGRGPLPFTIRLGDVGKRPPHPPGVPHVEGPPPPGGPDGPPRGPDGPRARRPDGPPGPPERGERDGGRRDPRERQRGGSVEQRLEELSQRMHEMRHHMEELRDSIRREHRQDRDDDNEE